MDDEEGLSDSSHTIGQSQEQLSLTQIGRKDVSESHEVTHEKSKQLKALINPLGVASWKQAVTNGVAWMESV